MIKLALPAGKATPAPPVGPALGQHGLNIMNFCKEYNARTADKGDLIIPVEISAFEDRSFLFCGRLHPFPSCWLKPQIFQKDLENQIK